MTDNEMIARFMGLETISKAIFEQCPEKYNVTTHSIAEYQRYHLEWNWLMPVVEKIEGTNIRDYTK